MQLLLSLVLAPHRALRYADGELHRAELLGPPRARFVNARSACANCSGASLMWSWKRRTAAVRQARELRGDLRRRERLRRSRDRRAVIDECHQRVLLRDAEARRERDCCRAMHKQHAFTRARVRLQTGSCEFSSGPSDELSRLRVR